MYRLGLENIIRNRKYTYYKYILIIDMKYIYLYIFILFNVIIFVSCLNIYYDGFEHFDLNKNKIILLGDSVIKNNAYVSYGKSIEDILVEKTNGKTICYAVDNSKIANVYNQIGKIPSSLGLNDENTLVFLSVGGNDILFYYLENNHNSANTSILQNIFTDYKNLIEAIRFKLPRAKLYLLDLYYPANEKYIHLYHIIAEWNRLIYSLADNLQNNISGVIKISSLLKNNEDFYYEIEPSSTGGQKIAESILEINL